VTGAALALLFQSSLLGAIDDRPPAGFDVVRYEFTVALEASTDDIRVIAAVEARVLVDGAPLALDLDPTMRVATVEVDGAPLGRGGWTQDGRGVTIPHERPAGSTVTVRLAYGGVPSRGLRIGPNLRQGQRGMARRRAVRMAGRGQWVARRRRHVAGERQHGLDLGRTASDPRAHDGRGSGAVRRSGTRRRRPRPTSRGLGLRG
jgi:hypothetical protein